MDGGGRWSGFVCDSIGAYGCDQVLPDCQERADDCGGGIVGIGDQIKGHGQGYRIDHKDELVEQRAVIAIGEDNALVNAAGQWDRQEARGGADDQGARLARVPENEFRLGVVIRFLVQLFDSRHLASGFSNLDAIGHEDDTPLDRVDERFEREEHQAHPSAG